MKRLIIATTLYCTGLFVHAQELSLPMEHAVAICSELTKAIGSINTTRLKAANKAFKTAQLANFNDLWLQEGEEIELDRHFVFDEVFVDSLIENREIINFSSVYVDKRGNRAPKDKNRVKIVTKALEAGKKAVWMTMNHNNAEYAVVGEPHGSFTMTIRNENGKALYVEKHNNKIGEPIRKVQIQLPDETTMLYIEVHNCGDTDASFALLGN